MFKLHVQNLTSLWFHNFLIICDIICNFSLITYFIFSQTYYLYLKVMRLDFVHHILNENKQAMIENVLLLLFMCWLISQIISKCYMKFNLSHHEYKINRIKINVCFCTILLFFNNIWILFEKSYIYVHIKFMLNQN